MFSAPQNSPRIQSAPSRPRGIHVATHGVPNACGRPVCRAGRTARRARRARSPCTPLCIPFVPLILKAGIRAIASESRKRRVAASGWSTRLACCLRRPAADTRCSCVRERRADLMTLSWYQTCRGKSGSIILKTEMDGRGMGAKE